MADQKHILLIHDTVTLDSLYKYYSFMIQLLLTLYAMVFPSGGHFLAWNLVMHEISVIIINVFIIGHGREYT